MIRLQLERKVGKHRIVLRADLIGNDLLVVVYGGDEHHIGGVSVAYLTRSHYRDASTVSVNTLTLPGHKDYVVANSAAEKLCKQLNRSAVVCVGIHMENATPREIDGAVSAVDSMTDELIAHLQKEASETNR